MSDKVFTKEPISFSFMSGVWLKHIPFYYSFLLSWDFWYPNMKKHICITLNNDGIKNTKKLHNCLF